MTFLPSEIGSGKFSHFSTKEPILRVGARQIVSMNWSFTLTSTDKFLAIDEYFMISRFCVARCASIVYDTEDMPGSIISALPLVAPIKSLISQFEHCASSASYCSPRLEITTSVFNIGYSCLMVSRQLLMGSCTKRYGNTYSKKKDLSKSLRHEAWFHTSQASLITFIR